MNDDAFSDDTLLEPDINKVVRLKHYRRFVRIDPGVAVLDVGQPNWIGKQLCPVADNLCGIDFDFPVIVFGHYDVIFCFEVLEHLCNWMQFLIDLRRGLRGGGRIYLSTPLFSPMIVSPYHIAELRREALEFVINKAGLKIVRVEIFRHWPWWNAFTGFRPAIRCLIHKTILFELEKK